MVGGIELSKTVGLEASNAVKGDIAIEPSSFVGAENRVDRACMN